jgi:D-tyrosyl-tRNA(Tyr) deacylase
MRAVVQRVASARVEVAGATVGCIAAGLLMLVAVEAADGEDDVIWLSGKLSRLRIFPDADAVMNQSVVEIGGEVLAVSQFTLFASLRRGNRPSWSRAAPPEVSRPLFECFVRRLEADLGRPVPTGVFGAEMQVHLVNDGPVTLFLDSRARE